MKTKRHLEVINEAAAKVLILTEETKSFLPLPLISHVSLWELLPNGNVWYVGITDDNKSIHLTMFSLLQGLCDRKPN